MPPPRPAGVGAVAALTVASAPGRIDRPGDHADGEVHGEEADHEERGGQSGLVALREPDARSPARTSSRGRSCCGRVAGHDARVVRGLRAALEQQLDDPLHDPDAAGDQVGRKRQVREQEQRQRGQQGDMSRNRIQVGTRSGGSSAPFAARDSSEVFEPSIDKPEPHSDADEPARHPEQRRRADRQPIPRPTAAHERIAPISSAPAPAGLAPGGRSCGSWGCRGRAACVVPPPPAGSATRQSTCTERRRPPAGVNPPAHSEFLFRRGLLPGALQPSSRPFSPLRSGVAAAREDSEKSDFVTTL